jgi:hypothetical protein
MLQRIQTIWLLLASACAFAGLKFSFYLGMLTGSAEQTFINGFYNFPLTLLTIVIGVLTLSSVFLYSNRKLQIRFCIISILLEGLVIFLYWNEMKKFASGTLSLTAVLQILVLLFVSLAIKGISKDNKIIAESDRLR